MLAEPRPRVTRTARSRGWAAGARVCGNAPGSLGEADATRGYAVRALVVGGGVAGPVAAMALQLSLIHI